MLNSKLSLDFIEVSNGLICYSLVENNRHQKNMLSLLLLTPCVVLWLFFYAQGQFWRQSLLSAFVVWGLLITGITEFLSLFNFFTIASVLGVWLFLNFISIFVYLRVYSLPVLDLFRFTKEQLKMRSRFLLFVLMSVIFIVVIIGLIAILSPPNNWDSMDYHLSRVVHWIQNHSIKHYPTSYTPQLYQNPWSEYVILHFQILTGGDYLANFVQCFSMVGSIIGISLIAQQLGANFNGQIFAAVFVATIPMGILQASNTQNDYVLAFWLVCLAHFILSAIQQKDRINWVNAFYIGSTTGLAILSKGTSYFYVLPFLIWFGLYSLKQLKWQFWKPNLIIAIITISLNISHYFRNYQVFGSFLGSPGDYRNGVINLSTLISNVLRNVALHLGSPFGFINGRFNKLIHVIHDILVVFILSSLPWLFLNKYRPIFHPTNSILVVNRMDQYFSNRPELLEPFKETVKFLNSQNCPKIGLQMGNDAWEYPLWVMLQNSQPQNLEIRHINVDNASAKLAETSPHSNFVPCRIIQMRTKRSGQKSHENIIFKDQTYQQQWEKEPIAIFKPESP
ncbi:ArnT family glycosyltransferase [Planktothrix rubescens]|uniref:ArnT family glycosyltransferase n=1 Tax=Planktothrix rubescens TaxID=59512 RepID=UPI000693FA64|nr:hypothetical protein [Planktothrix rubescens]